MALWADFKKFAFKGNVVDLAVGVIIGAAFGEIVKKLVSDIIMPLVSLILPGGAWRDNRWVLRAAGADGTGEVAILWGSFLGQILDFMIVSFALFLIVTRIVQAMQSKKADEPAPETKDCPFCFETIPLKASRCKACTSELPAKA